MPGARMNFAYIQAQTFGDAALEAELLVLFLDQARRLVTVLPRQAPDHQARTTHLLRGSASAVGAAEVVAALEIYEATAPDARAEGSVGFTGLLAALADASEAIAARLAVIGTGRG